MVLSVMLRIVNRFLPRTLEMHTKAHTVRGRPTLRDEERQFLKWVGQQENSNLPMKSSETKITEM